LHADGQTAEVTAAQTSLVTAVERMRACERPVAVDISPGADLAFARVDARQAGANQRFAAHVARSRSVAPRSIAPVAGASTTRSTSRAASTRIGPSAPRAATRPASLRRGSP